MTIEHVFVVFVRIALSKMTMHFFGAKRSARARSNQNVSCSLRQWFDAMYNGVTREKENEWESVCCAHESKFGGRHQGAQKHTHQHLKKKYIQSLFGNIRWTVSFSLSFFAHFFFLSLFPFKCHRLLYFWFFFLHFKRIPTYFYSCRLIWFRYCWCDTIDFTHYIPSKHSITYSLCLCIHNISECKLQLQTQTVKQIVNGFQCIQFLHFLYSINISWNDPYWFYNCWINVIDISRESLRFKLRLNEMQEVKKSWDKRVCDRRLFCIFYVSCFIHQCSFRVDSIHCKALYCYYWHEQETF